MQRYKIVHRTFYNFSAAVRLEPHALRLRPREGHELRIESSYLNISPPSTLRWHRDVYDNSVAIATFDSPASQLSIESEVIIQQHNRAPLDFLVDDYAVNYPFDYRAEDRVVLLPYMKVATHETMGPMTEWLKNVWQPGEGLQTYALLQRLSGHIDAGGDGSAQVIAFFGDGIKRGGGTKIDNAGRAAIEHLDGGSIGDAVGAYQARLFIEDAHAGLDACIDHQRVLIEVLLAGLPDLASQRRYHRRHADPFNTFNGDA